MEKISRKKLSGLIIICAIVSIAFLTFYFMYTPPAPGISRHDRALLDIYGTKIVWNDYRNDNWDIYMYDLETESEIQITTNEADQRWPQIYDDKIIWLDHRNDTGYYKNCDIYMYNLSTKKEMHIAHLTKSPTVPGMMDIYGDKIVWVDNRDGDFDIYLYDCSSNMETLITHDNADQICPAIYKDKILWMDYRDYGNSDIYMYNLSTKTETLLYEKGHGQHSLRLFENKVLWVEKSSQLSLDIEPPLGVYLYDLVDGNVTILEKNDTTLFKPSIYDDKIVYLCGKGQSWSVCLYDLLEDNETIIADVENYWSPKIYGDIIIWKDYWGNNIYEYDIRTGISKTIVTNSVLIDD